MNKIPLIVEHNDLIFLITHISPKLRKEVLKGLKKRELNCISEMFSNFLRRRLTDNSNTMNKLRKFKEDIHSVSLKSTPVIGKKAIILSKRGGSILAALLPLAARVLTNLLQK